MGEPVTNNNQYSAAVIEQYLQGKLSPAAMHALEKAALEDPFLAEALEGYTATPVNISADLAALQQQLIAQRNKNETAPVVPMSRSKWWRLSIAAALLIGASVLAYQLMVNPGKQTPGIAKTTEKNTTAAQPAIPQADSVSNLTSNPAQDNKNTDNAATQPATNIAKLPTTSSNPATIPSGTDTPLPANKDIAGRKTADAPPAKEIAAAPTASEAAETRDVVVTMEKRKAANYDDRNVTHYFKGRVTDRSNNPLPYARINIKPNNIGTYADARGNFTLISSDTSLQIEVKANGYEVSQVNLDRNRNLNSVQLSEEKRSLNRAEVVGNATNYNLKKRSGVIKGAIVEPEEGWESYDAYLVNNLEVPLEVRKKHINGQVEVLVEVDQQGNVTSVQVDKSLCQQCDQEAVRLVKEGPKWKAAKGGKGKVKVVVNFNE
jgi:TonB family protein